MTILLLNHNETKVKQLSVELSMQYPMARILISHDPTANGKGWALRQGLEYADPPIIFIDGDRDIPAVEINKLLPYTSQYDIVVGKKQLPSGYRKIITILSRIYIKWLFGLKIDTQTGLKIFNYIPEITINSWACDIEILYKAKLQNKTIFEVPITATVSKPKSLLDLWRTFWDSLRIRFFLS